MYLRCECIEQRMFETAFKNFKHIPFSFFFDCIPTIEQLSINEINIYAHSEPDEYLGRHKWLLENANLFSYVMTWNQEILDKYSHARLMPYAESWVDHGDPNVIYTVDQKDFEISFIRGNKLMAPGHTLRHQIFDCKDKIKIPTRFYASTDTSSGSSTINSKVLAHKTAMFSLVIENTYHLNYFTEKISDCMIMKTIPVYWGCPNIGNFYNQKGIVTIENTDDAIEKINKLTPEFYLENKDVIEENWQKALMYRHYVTRIAENLKEIFTLNNLL